jgi:hypothetical protein
MHRISLYIHFHERAELSVKIQITLRRRKERCYTNVLFQQLAISRYYFDERIMDMKRFNVRMNRR